VGSGRTRSARPEGCSGWASSSRRRKGSHAIEAEGLVCPEGRASRAPVYWPGGARRRGGVSLICGSCKEREKASVDTATGVLGAQVARGSVPRRKPKALSTNEAVAGGPARTSGEALAHWGGGGGKGPAHQECSVRTRRAGPRWERRQPPPRRRVPELPSANTLAMEGLGLSVPRASPCLHPRDGRRPDLGSSDGVQRWHFPVVDLEWRA
jgi:hypothetical protein